MAGSSGVRRRLLGAALLLATGGTAAATASRGGHLRQRRAATRPAAGAADGGKDCAGIDKAACRSRQATCRWARAKEKCVPRKAKAVGCQAGADGTGAGCPAGAYCKLATGICADLDRDETRAGRCVGTGVTCARGGAPVCGCDGQTYDNQCEARKAGTSVARAGACERRAPPEAIVRPAGRPGVEVACAAGAAGRSGDCGEGLFCQLRGGVCGALGPTATAAGRCVPTGGVCTEQYEPVCGCDGKTYGNACRARGAGMSAAAKGACGGSSKPPRPPPSGPSVQGGACAAGADGRSADCAEGSFCQLDGGVCARLDGDDADARGQGKCEPKDGVCAAQYQPVCGCDGKTYGNACRAGARGMSVAARGECGGTKPPKPPRPPKPVGPEPGSGPGTQDSACEAAADGSSADCDEGGFCFLAPGTCGALDGTTKAAGQCQVKPENCHRNFEPVCGCNGETYSNACMASAQGMSVAGEGRCAETVAVEWEVKEYPAMTANVGDTVTFDWVGTHNVYIHPTGDCDATGAIVVGVESPAAYTFNETGKITFACDAFNGAHCQAGQIVAFEVGAAGGAGASTGTGSGGRPKPKPPPGTAGTGPSKPKPPSKPEPPPGPDVQDKACAADAAGRSDDNCGRDGFCQLAAAACRRPSAAKVGGRCAAAAEVCTMEVREVCGCDGKTYGNPCQAASRRMSVAHEGSCGRGKGEGAGAGGRPGSRPVKPSLFN